MDPLSLKVDQIVAGEDHTLVLMQDHKTLYSFGSNQQGQLGHGNLRNYKEPQIVQIKTEEHEAEFEIK